ncbi:MAG: hypothetical protein DRP06_00980 [Candidatus Aenigmatarchaeota archaeon]|nr:MAG: hypothetical protein DRP06_00980 [Candidatus Aenigmarchaeota archaeon]
MGYIQNYVKQSNHRGIINDKPCRTETFVIRAVGTFDPEELLTKYFKKKHEKNYHSHEINNLYPEYKQLNSLGVPGLSKSTECSYFIEGNVIIYQDIQTEL